MIVRIKTETHAWAAWMEQPRPAMEKAMKNAILEMRILGRWVILRGISGVPVGLGQRFVWIKMEKAVTAA